MNFQTFLATCKRKGVFTSTSKKKKNPKIDLNNDITNDVIICLSGLLTNFFGHGF
jgi:hypothetical protein